MCVSVQFSIVFGFTGNTGCPTSEGHYFGRVFLMLKYTDTTPNTYVES